MRPLRVGRQTLRHAQRVAALHLQHQAGLAAVWHANISTSPTARARRSHQDDDRIKVNIFEQDAGGPRGPTRKRRRLKANELDTGDEDADDALDFDGQADLMEALDKPLDESTQAEVDKAIRQIFTDDELRRMREAMSSAAPDSGKSDVSDMPTESDIFADAFQSHHLSPQKAIPRQSQVFVSRMNLLLDSVSTFSADEETKRQLWKWYIRSKTNVPGFLRMIPENAWHLLWDSQSADVASNPDRASHLRTLADDKLSVDWPLTQEETLARLEGMFWNGEQERALKDYEDLAQKDNDNVAVLELGMRMYAVSDQPDKSLEVLDRIFALDRTANPRLTLILIKAYAAQGSEPSAVKAWELYNDLKSRLSSDMKMDDFDMVSLEFMSAGHKDLALAVFRDMMLAGEASKEGRTAFAASKALSRHAEFTRLGSAQQSTQLALDSIKHLPRRFQNKFFYGSWIRKLISEGETDAAAQVIELMYERGVKPDARYMNGLIAAWLRGDDRHSKQRAEELGWTMIQERVNFVSQRKRQDSDGLAPSPKSVRDNEVDVQIPLSVGRPVPPATIETFAILVQHYARRTAFAYIRHLRDLLVDAELPMNSYFMNHVLYAELRTRGYQYAFARFQVMRPDVKPDLETFLCLWQCVKQHIHEQRHHLQRDYSGLPSHRELFAWMVQWLDSLSGQELTQAIDTLDANKYHHILRAYCIAHDLEGLMVALHALRERFGAVPNEESLQMILTMMTQIEPPAKRGAVPQSRARGLRRMRILKKPATTLKVESSRAAALAEAIRETRTKQYAAQDVELDALPAEQQAEEFYRLCLELVWTVKRRTEGPKSLHATTIAEAAADMSVLPFDIDRAMQLTVYDEEVDA